jgi:hypothetical protein
MLGNCLASTGAGISSFEKRGTILSRLAACHTAKATSSTTFYRKIPSTSEKNRVSGLKWVWTGYKPKSPVRGY